MFGWDNLRVIHLFEEFENLWSKMTFLDEEIKGKLKLRSFKEVFKITKIIEFEIHTKIKENWNFRSCKISHWSEWKKSTSPKSRLI